MAYGIEASKGKEGGRFCGVREGDSSRQKNSDARACTRSLVARRLASPVALVNRLNFFITVCLLSHTHRRIRKKSPRCSDFRHATRPRHPGPQLLSYLARWLLTVYRGRKIKDARCTGAYVSVIWKFGTTNQEHNILRNA